MEKEFICEMCGAKHDGSYGTGRFCSNHCSSVYAGKMVKNHSNLEEVHKKQRAPFGRWKCYYCNFIAESRRELVKHKKTLHADKSHSAWNKGLTKDTDERLKKSGETYKKGLEEGKFKPIPHRWTPEEKERISKIRSEWLMNHEGSGFKDIPYYKVKNIDGMEYSVRGSWELKVAEKLNEMGIFWERNHLLKYEKDSLLKNYNPDFYLPALDEYIEVKGYYSDKDREKMEAVKSYNKRCQDQDDIL